VRKLKRIVLAVLTIALVSVVAVGATVAKLSDTETSNDNTFTSGTLDLTVDGNNGINTVKWTVGPMKPGNQPKGTFQLANAGNLAGYLDLENIVVTSSENGIQEPEAEAGDVTDPEGELEDVLNLRLFHDVDCDGWIGAGETVFFNGKVGTIASGYDLNISIPAGGNSCITGIYDWWDTPDDNKAMSDSFELDMTFELGQTTGQ
jgi:predicted ribosomally synthesized peptide with SipW-like signal peptide